MIILQVNSLLITHNRPSGQAKALTIQPYLANFSQDFWIVSLTFLLGRHICIDLIQYFSLQALRGFSHELLL